MELKSLSLLALLAALSAPSVAEAATLCSNMPVGFSTSQPLTYTNFKYKVYSERTAFEGKSELHLTGWMAEKGDILGGLHYADGTKGDVSKAASSTLFCNKLADRAQKMLTDAGFSATNGRNAKNANGYVVQLKVVHDCSFQVPPSSYITIKECTLNGEVPADLLAEATAELQAQLVKLTPPAPPSAEVQAKKDAAMKGTAAEVMTRPKKK